MRKRPFGLLCSFVISLESGTVGVLRACSLTGRWVREGSKAGQLESTAEAEAPRCCWCWCLQGMQTSHPVSGPWMRNRAVGPGGWTGNKEGGEWLSDSPIHWSQHSASVELDVALEFSEEPSIKFLPSPCMRGRHVASSAVVQGPMPAVEDVLLKQTPTGSRSLSWSLITVYVLWLFRDCMASPSSLPHSFLDVELIFSWNLFS